MTAVKSNALDKERQVLRGLSKLSRMKGFPDDLTMFVHAIGRFVQGREVDHAELGTVNDVDWLVGQIASTCEFFPMPVQARRIYQGYFPPADGMEVSLEEE